MKAGAVGRGVSRSPILGGTVLANTVRSVVALVAMVLMGLLVGFRPDADLGGSGSAAVVMMLFRRRFS